MAVDHLSFLTFSEGLLNSGSEEEIDLRNVMSRAYYSAFHHCKLTESECNITSHSGMRGGGNHELLISKFETITESKQPHLHEDSVTKLRQIGIMMIQARKGRVKADYNITSDVTKPEAAALFISIKRIGDLCQEVISIENGSVA